MLNIQFSMFNSQYGDGLTAVHPPSIIRLCPVICLDEGETRNNAALAISSTEAGRPIGVIRLQVFSYSASPAVLSVKVAPGAMAFTEMLNGDSSTTNDFASISMPAFVIPYAARFLCA